MNLTANQVASLKAIAEKYKMRLLVSRTQVGIGPAGELAFNVVYTHGTRKPWELRNESDRAIKDEMKAILN